MATESYFKKVKVLDGGFGSQISKLVEKPVDGDALWSARFLATNKQAVIDTHLAFLRAGADVIETNTYQASIEGFKIHLNVTDKEAYDLIKEAVYLVKEARSIYMKETLCDDNETKPLVAGSVGPFGASLLDGSEYTGSYAEEISKTELKDWHRPRMSALYEAGVDLFALETIPCRKEAEVLLDLITEYENSKAWISFNCKDGKTLASGENFQDAVTHCFDLNRNQLIAIGANCLSPVIVEELFSDINESRCHDPIPLIVYPNSGEVYVKNNGWCDKDKCRPVESYVKKWLDMGIKGIGGCCRMYAEEIKKIRDEVDEWERNNDLEKNKNQ